MAHVRGKLTDVDRSLATLKRALRNKDTSALQPTHKKAFKTLDSLYSVFFEQHTAESLQNVESKIASVSLDNDVLLDVKFTTKRGGATIKYLSVKDNVPTSCNQTTNNCIAKLPIGKCAFWSERNGKRTSDVYLKTFDENRTFEIVEGKLDTTVGRMNKQFQKSHYLSLQNYQDFDNILH